MIELFRFVLARQDSSIPYNKDAPVSRSVRRADVISSRAVLGGLHHRYGRI